jgi:hypothetical protein
MATRQLNTIPPALPITAAPKSRATVFDEATTDASRAIKYDTLAARNSASTTVIDECKTLGKSRIGLIISPATNCGWFSMIHAGTRAYTALVPTIKRPKSRVQCDRITRRTFRGSRKEVSRCKGLTGTIADQGNKSQKCNKDQGEHFYDGQEDLCT